MMNKWKAAWSSRSSIWHIVNAFEQAGVVGLGLRETV